MADEWKPPTGDAWTPPAADAWTPPAADAGPEPTGVAKTLQTIQSYTDPANVLSPDVLLAPFGPAIINYLNPLPAIAADASALAHGALPTDKASRKEFYDRRQKALDTAQLPEGRLSRALSDVLALPGEGIQNLAQRAGRATIDRVIPGATEAIGPYATMAMDVGMPFLAARAGRYGAERRAASAPAEDVRAAKTENKARKQLSESFETGLYEGGPNALGAIEEMQKARAAGQPYALMDLNNPELQGRIGTVYRQGGAGAGIIKDFLDQRHGEQVPRAERIIGEGLGDAHTFRETADILRERRSANARPLFDAAAEGPGLKALEQQFTDAFQMSGRLEREARQRVAQAEAALTQATARQSQAGNVYSSSASTSAVRDAQAAVTAAKQELATAQTEKARTQSLMQQAQKDGTWRPDATWSPYLQMLLDTNPHVKRGIRRGWDIERNKAHGQGQQPNPRDYAIVGTDDKGRPIVGAVPNMRLWMVAKEGLDAEIESRITKKHGEIDKTAHGLMMLRDGLLGELDRLNPRYKTARDQWAGDSASRAAMTRGENLFNEKAFKTDADVAQYLGTLNPADLEFVKLGLAQKLLADVRRAPDAADKAKRVVNTDTARTRLEMLLGPEAQRFLEAVEREAEMEKTRQKIMGGSPTREREATDKRSKERMATAGGSFIENLVRLHPIQALHAAGRLYKALRNRPDLKTNESAARLATNPDLPLSAVPGRPILSPADVPYRSMLTGPRAAAGAELAMPHEDDPVARALRQ